MRATGAL